MTQNSAASIRQRLKNLAREKNEAFDFVLQQFVAQRLLYRLSVSEYQDQFLLKGAMLFLIWNGNLHRPTKDIDLLGFGDNDITSLENTFRHICSLEANDGLIFDLKTIKGAEIKKDDLYQGVRIKGFGYLENAKIHIQIDIGYGDAVTPTAEFSEIPAFLDLPAPKLRVYPVYTVVAEKLQAMISLGVANSRMKDFYDIWLIGSNWALEGPLLVDAISATFKRRKTVLPPEPAFIFS